MMRTRFVTSSGTEIGKTFVAASLCAQLRARGRGVAALKPVVSGWDAAAAAASDPGILLAALGVPASAAAVEAISPWRFAAPLSPDMAARREGRRIDFDALVAFCRAAMTRAHDDLLIEGVGGVMAPVGERHTVRDWIAALGVPALLVVGSYLGTISHTLTALAALREAGIPIDAVVVVESPDQPVPVAETAAAIGRFADGLRVATLARSPAGTPYSAEPGALLDRLGWPGAEPGSIARAAAG